MQQAVKQRKEVKRAIFTPTDGIEPAHSRFIADLRRRHAHSQLTTDNRAVAVASSGGLRCLIGQAGSSGRQI